MKENNNTSVTWSYLWKYDQFWLNSGKKVKLFLLESIKKKIDNFILKF